MVDPERNDNEALNEAASGLTKTKCILEIAIAIFIKLIGLRIAMIWTVHHSRWCTQMNF